MFHKVILVGNLGRDPEMRYTPGGQAVTNLSVATNRRYTDSSGEMRDETVWFRVSVWGKQAENCSQYLAKGKLVAVNGSIQTGSYQTQTGDTRYTTEVLANRVEFLEWGEKTQSKPKEDDFSFSGGFEDYKAVEDDDDIPF